MRLLASSALWWLLLGAIIIFFYLLKLRRKPTVVPSTLLWLRALQEVEANAPFKKLRRSLLLILQLLALAALVFALARPQVSTRALAAGSTIIVIDSTASMSARDEDGSRLDRAKQVAREMIETLGAADRAAIVEASSRVTVRSPLTSDRTALARSIDDIQQTDAPGSPAESLSLAEQIAGSERDASVIIISDGGGGSSSDAQPPSAQMPAERGLRFVKVGRRADNAGVIAFNSRRPTAGGRRELFASVANFADHARSVGVELRIDGRLIDARAIDLAAGDRRGLAFDSLLPDGGLAELKLDADDDLASDNIAFAFLPTSRRVRVGVASENPFLLNALAANPDIDAVRIAPGDAAIQSADAEFDCIVVEGASGAGFFVSKRPMLAIDPPDAAGLWRVTGQRERPQITSVERSHPVNSFLSYVDLHVESFSSRDTAPWLKPIVGDGAESLVWAGDDGRRRVVMIGFDLARSDLPLKVEFPILLANSVAWLSGGKSASTERAVRAGQPATLYTSQKSASVTTPAGDVREVEARDGSAVFADTLRVGSYAVKGEPVFAVSLLSESESNTAPRDSVKTRAGEIGGQERTFRTEREAWRWVALIAVVALTIEWWAFHRRIS